MSSFEELVKLEKGAQRSGEARLMDCMEGTYNDEAGDSAVGAFCGCDTCIVREVLDAAWPWLYKMAHHPDTVPPT